MLVPTTFATETKIIPLSISEAIHELVPYIETRILYVFFLWGIYPFGIILKF